MKLTVLIFLGLLLQVVVTNPIYDTEEYVAKNDQKDLQRKNVLTLEQKKNSYLKTVERNGIISAKLRWPYGVIPYVISDDFTKSQKNLIEKVLEEAYSKTCIRIIPRTSHVDYVYVTGNNTGCWSFVGRLVGEQELNLESARCLTNLSIVHEFLHAAGFYHMHSAAERDKFITVKWQNIISGDEIHFQKYAANVVSSFGQPYDYQSLLHLTEFRFSKNGLQTIVPQKNVLVGGSTKLTSIDIAKLNRMYDC